MSDRRMSIMALCNAEEPVWSKSPTTGTSSSLPPSVPLCYTGNSLKQLATTVANASNGKPLTKKRSNSERGKLYRSRQKNYVQTLEEQVKQLKKEVDNLDLRGHSRQRVATWPIKRQPMGASFASVVNEYFSLFKYGVPVAGQGGVSKAVLVMHCSSKHVQIAMGYTCKLKGTRYVRAPFMLAAPLPKKVIIMVII